MSSLKFRRVTDGKVVAHEAYTAYDADLPGRWIALIEARRSTGLPLLEPLLREVGMREESLFAAALKRVTGLSTEEREKLRRDGIGAKYATKTSVTETLAAVRAVAPDAFPSLDHPIVLTRHRGLWYTPVDGRLDVAGYVTPEPALAADHQRLFDALRDHLGSRKTGVARIKVTKSPWTESSLYVTVVDGDLHRFVLSVDPKAYELRRETRAHTKSSQWSVSDRWHGRVHGAQLEPIKAPRIDVAIILQQLFDAALAYWAKHSVATGGDRS